MPLLNPNELNACCEFLRDIFADRGYRQDIEPSILCWQNGLIPKLAQAAYDERQLPEGTLDNGRLAILADALEEAGCTDADILGHLRGLIRQGLRKPGCALRLHYSTARTNGAAPR